MKYKVCSPYVCFSIDVKYACLFHEGSPSRRSILGHESDTIGSELLNFDNYRYKSFYTKI